MTDHTDAQAGADLPTMIHTLAESAVLNWASVARVLGTSKSTVSRVLTAKGPKKGVLYTAMFRRASKLLAEDKRVGVFANLHELSQQEKVDALIGVLYR